MDGAEWVAVEFLFRLFYSVIVCGYALFGHVQSLILSSISNGANVVI